MKRLLFVITNLGLFTSAFAIKTNANSIDTLTCQFYEKSLQLNFDIASGAVTYTDDEHVDPQTGEQKHVSLFQSAELVGSDLDQHLLGSIFQVLTSEGEEILSLRLTFAGFDGSSAYLLYPFEAEYHSASGDILKGGCFIPTRPFYQVVELSND